MPSVFIESIIPCSHEILRDRSSACLHKITDESGLLDSVATARYTRLFTLDVSTVVLANTFFIESALWRCAEAGISKPSKTITDKKQDLNCNELFKQIYG